MDQQQKDQLIAQKLAAAKEGREVVKRPSAPVKKTAGAMKASAGAGGKAGTGKAGRPVGGTVGLAAVCRTSGCSEQGTRKTFRVPAIGSIALLPGGVFCLACEHEMRWDRDDVVVDRMEEA